jgi:NADH-quinone oxidoreductase subunit D
MSATTHDYYASPGQEPADAVYTAMGGDWAEIAQEQAERSDDTMVINMGPQHPSTHGVLRLDPGV